MISNFLEYWKREWSENRFLFWVEILGTIFSVIGATAMSVTAPYPPLLPIFICYFIGSSLLAIGSWIRKAGWLLVLMSFYTLMNIVGLINLVVK